MSDPKRARLDVDEDLYGGFVGNGDRRRLNDLRAMTPEQLTSAHPAFDDARLPELLFRYRARNFPDGLTDDEAARWEAHRAERLFDGAGGARTVEQLFDAIDQLSEAPTSVARPFWAHCTITPSPSRPQRD